MNLITFHCFYCKNLNNFLFAHSNPSYVKFCVNTDQTTALLHENPINGHLKLKWQQHSLHSNFPAMNIPSRFQPPRFVGVKQ